MCFSCSEKLTVSFARGKTEKQRILWILNGITEKKKQEKTQKNDKETKKEKKSEKNDVRYIKYTVFLNKEPVRRPSIHLESLCIRIAQVFRFSFEVI